MGLGMVVRNIAFVEPLYRYIFQGSVDWFLVHPHIEDMKHYSASSTEQDVDSVYYVQSGDRLVCTLQLNYSVLHTLMFDVNVAGGLT